MKKTINGHIEFGQEIAPIVLSSKNIRILALVRLINGLPAGCGCNRKAREISAINGFRQVCGLFTDVDKTEIKAHFNAETVEIAEGGAVFCIF